jgi:hypothetical protein
VEKLLRASVDKADGAENQARALLNLAQFLINKAEAIYTVKGADAEQLQQLEAVYGKDFPKLVQSQDPGKINKEAEEQLERLIKKYSDVKSDGQSLAEEAKNSLFELRNLAIGKPALEIEGEDVDGVKFKLSDYRGKVVVLDFWGHW